MVTSNRKFRTIDEYITVVPKNVRDILHDVRKSIRDAAPQAEEAIGYQIPMFKLNGYLMYFAAVRNHIALYSTMSAIRSFERDLSPYWGKRTNGTVQFSIDKPIPFDLVEQIVEFRAIQNMEKAKRQEEQGSSRPSGP